MSKRLKYKKSKSILKYILIPVSLLLILEVGVFTGVIAAGGVNQQLEQNARDILQERTINRKSFLENEMLTNWSNLSLLTDQINKEAKVLYEQGMLDYKTLDESSENAKGLLLKVYDDMIANLRSLHVNGVFVVFNNHDLNGKVGNKPGLYIRDLDPISKPSENNDDLLMERGSIALIDEMDISTDTTWNPQITFAKGDEKYYPFLYYPYQEAIKNKNGCTASDLGYWSPTYRLNGDNRDAISYSIPLINESGYVYGVVGVEILHEYLSTLLPASEISESNKGSYSLSITNDDGKYQQVFSDGQKYTDKNIFGLKKIDENMYLEGSEDLVYASKETLELYNSNTPYEDNKWVLLALLPNDNLLAFSNNINFILLIAIILTIVFGISGSVFISLRLSHPITLLSNQIKKTKNVKNIELEKTNISEIDHLIDSIENLNASVLETAYRFNKIIELASVHLAAFEINVENNLFFLTENYFNVFQQYNINQEEITLDQFKVLMTYLEQYIINRDVDKYLFHIPRKDDYVFIELTISKISEFHTIGMAEDITQRVLEKNIIEYERDHDALTGLLNRRAFWREIDAMFQSKKEELKIAAFVMIDLDNLKFINDNYGHDSGDTYILKATEAFVKNSPEKTLISRISGDEFHLFFYGYDSEEQIRKLLKKLKQGIDDSYMTLANQKQFHVKVSGGISWYPKDSDSVEKLQLYSDYAMYKVKHSIKGEFLDFSLENYQLDYYLNRNKEELEIMISEEQLQYYYQPIISAKNGKLFAYEALMRSSMPTLKNPEEILELAKQENKLDHIEELTFFKAMEGYLENIETGNINSDSKIFINSIASHIMSESKITEWETKYAAYTHNVVVEVTEGEKINEPFHRLKQQHIEKWNAEFALDDYGSGYNSEKMLLDIKPKYIKIDMEIIRNIDKNRDKQKIVENIVSFAHERSMLLIAEGIETVEELKQVIKLEVDLLQGFLIAKPQKSPTKVSNDIILLIHSLYKNK